MTFRKIPVWLIALVILVVIISVALWLRMVLPYDQVFVKDWVKMTGVDTYYMMRLVDNVVQHFPELTQFDPYNVYPGGYRTDNEPNFFIYLLGGVVWLLGGGNPDQHLTDVISVYIPPLMAVLTILAVFFIGKAMKNVWMGLLAAGLLAIMPGEFLNRSLLGYTDYHIAESMFTAFFMLLLILAMKNRDAIDATFRKEKNWKLIIKPAVYPVLAGLALALYMLTWSGAALFILISFLFLAIQILVDYANDRSSIATGAIGVVMFLVALIIYSPSGKSSFSLIAVVAAIVLTIVLAAMAEFMFRRKIKTPYYLLTIFLCGILGVGVLYLVIPEALALGLANLVRIFNWNPGTTIMEMQPMLLQQGSFSLLTVLGNYTWSGLLLGMSGLGLVIYHEIRRQEPGRLLLIVWSLVILLATLAMRRFSYYFAVNIAILSGYFCWWVLELAGSGMKEPAQEMRQDLPRTKASRQKKVRETRAVRRKPVLVSVTLAVMLIIIIWPSLGPMPGGGKPSIALATRPLFAPSDAWCESLDWLRANSPEPLGDPAAYYKTYNAPGSAGGYVYPQNAYGVLAWWDYGYWITRIGRRIPFSNPGTSATGGEAKFFLARDENTASDFLKDINIKYVIVDDEIASYERKFFALPVWMGSSYQDYYDVFLQKQDQSYTAMLLFYPEYYQSMVVRLYNFDGKAAAPAEVNVVRYEPVVAQDGIQYKVITEMKVFSSYGEASQYVDSQQPGTHRIVGRDPYVSPVPFEALNKFKLVYSSSQTKIDSQYTLPYIKIFEYQK